MRRWRRWRRCGQNQLRPYRRRACRDLAVGGETGETEKDAYQDSHGDGDGEGGREGIGDDTDDVGVGGRVTDDELEDVPEIAHENDEGKEGSAEEGVRGDFAEDVAGEDAHFLLLRFGYSSVSRVREFAIESQGLDGVGWARQLGEELRSLSVEAC